MALIAAISAGGAGRTVIASDTGARSNPVPFWGEIDCEKKSRHQLLGGGGDWHATAAGVSQGNSAFRRLTVFDGDDVWGERCELGWNDRRSPVAFYREGTRRITYMSFRFPSNFPLKASRWQGVMQMKQAAPADNSGGPPVLSLSAYQGRWFLWHSPPGYTYKENLLWSRKARRGVWTRFAFDIRYSKRKRKGRVRVFVDLNADGDFADKGERSRRIRTNTLKHEVAGTNSDGKRAGASLRSHLRVGIYHDTSIPCVTPAGCSVDVDNVQVLKP